MKVDGKSILNLHFRTSFESVNYLIKFKNLIAFKGELLFLAHCLQQQLVVYLNSQVDIRLHFR